MALNVIYKNRNGTTAEWAASTYILEKGELGVDTTLNIAKIGDGVKLWKNLPSLTGDLSKYVTIDTEQTITGIKTFNEITNFENGVSVGTADSTDRLNIGIDSENHTGFIEFASDAVVGCVLTLPDRSGTIATLDDIPSIPTNYVTTNTEQTISGKKTFNDSSFEITGGGNTWKINARTEEGPLNIVGQGAAGANTYQFPNKTGTIALTSDIPSTDNFVTLAGDQTISGAKTFNETTDFGNGVSVGITDSTDRINIGVDSENHAGIIEFASEAVVGCTLTLPDRSGTIAILDDIPSTNNLVTTDTAQTISGAKTFKSNLIVGTPSATSVTLSSNGKISNFQGIRGFDIDPSNFYIQAQQYGAYQRLKFSTSLGVVSANTYTIDVPVVDGTMLTSGNTKTIGGQSIEGSGDISVGDNETKVQFGDIIDHSSLQTTHNVTLNTDASNLQDKTITALWVRLINDTTNNVGYSYQIPIQDLYNFRDTSSSTLGAFSFLLAMPGSRWNLTFAKNSSVNITTMFMNGTLNYSIPLSLKMNGSTHPGSGVLLGFVYKGNKFAGSEVY